MNGGSTHEAEGVDLSDSHAESEDIFETYPRTANYRGRRRPTKAAGRFSGAWPRSIGYVGSKQVLEYYDALFQRPLPAFIHNFHWLCLAPRFIEPISTWLDGSPGIALLDEAGKATKRFCPDCIREGGHFLAEWSADTRVCWTHRSRLRNECWSCNRKLSWISGTWDACTCKASLLEPPRKPFRFGTDSFPTVEEWEIFERVDAASGNSNTRPRCSRTCLNG